MRALGSLAIVLSLCCALGSAAEGGRASRASSSRESKGKKASSNRGERGRASAHKRLTRRKRPPAPPPMPARLEVLSIEPKSGSIRVALLGPARPPETRLFVLTDERGRRFVPATAECSTGDAVADPTAAETTPVENQPLIHWQCELTVAPLYRHAALTGVSMEWGDRIISALPGQVRERWAEGPTSHPAPAPKSAPEKPAGKTTAPPPPSEAEPPEPPAGEDDEETDP